MNITGESDTEEEWHLMWRMLTPGSLRVPACSRNSGQRAHYDPGRDKTLLTSVVALFFCLKQGSCDFFVIARTFYLERQVRWMNTSQILSVQESFSCTRKQFSRLCPLAYYGLMPVRRIPFFCVSTVNCLINIFETSFLRQGRYQQSPN